MKRAVITRYYYDRFKATESDYIECTIDGGMSWRWRYIDMNAYAENKKNAYSIAENLYNKIIELVKSGYKITFRDKCLLIDGSTIESEV